MLSHVLIANTLATRTRVRHGSDDSIERVEPPCIFLYFWITDAPIHQTPICSSRIGFLHCTVRVSDKNSEYFACPPHPYLKRELFKYPISHTCHYLHNLQRYQNNSHLIFSPYYPFFCSKIRVCIAEHFAS